MPVRKTKASDLPPEPLQNRPTFGDPLAINARLYRQVSDMLDQLEGNDHVTLKERISALVAVGRLQTIFMALRKEKFDEPQRGSKVREYAKSFEKNDTGRRAAIPGPDDEPADELPDDIFSDDGDDD